MGNWIKYFGHFDKKGLFLPSDGSYFRDIEHIIELPIILSLRPAHKSMTGQQMRYYRGVVLPVIMEGLVECGHPRYEINLRDLHSFLWSKFGKLADWDIDEMEDLSTVLFMEYIESLQRFGAEFLDVYVPDPEKQLFNI